MNRLYRIINRTTDVIGIATFIAMCVVILFQVIMRYIFNNAQAWPEEIGRYFFLICTYASITLCVIKGKHLRVELLPELWKSKVRLFDLLSIVSSLTFFAVSIYILIKMAIKVYNMGTFALTFPFPMWPIWVFIIIFCLFCFLIYLQKLLIFWVKAEKE